jgi:hypothetical protein
MIDLQSLAVLPFFRFFGLIKEVDRSRVAVGSPHSNRWPGPQERGPRQLWNPNFVALIVFIFYVADKMITFTFFIHFFLFLLFSHLHLTQFQIHHLICETQCKSHKSKGKFKKEKNTHFPLKLPFNCQCLSKLQKNVNILTLRPTKRQK